MPLEVEEHVRIKHSRDFLRNLVAEPHSKHISVFSYLNVAFLVSVFLTIVDVLFEILNLRRDEIRTYLLSSSYFSGSKVSGFPLLSPLSVSPYSSM